MLSCKETLIKRRCPRNDSSFLFGFKIKKQGGPDEGPPVDFLRVFFETNDLVTIWSFDP